MFEWTIYLMLGEGPKLWANKQWSSYKDIACVTFMYIGQGILWHSIMLDCLKGKEGGAPSTYLTERRPFEGLFSSEIIILNLDLY